MITFFLALAPWIHPSIDDPKPPADAPKMGEVMNRVEGRTIILSLVPEGTLVKKGQDVGELDSAAFRDNLINRQIVVKLAEVEAQSARSNREVAEAAAKEEAAVVAIEINQAKERVKLAETGVAVADAKLDEARKSKMPTKINPAEIGKGKADIALRDRRLELRTLIDVTGPRRVREAETVTARARNEETAKAATLALEQAKEAKLRLQIEHCKLVAPIDGMVYYANPRDGRVDPLPIEEGATVRERQIILRIVPN